METHELEYMYDAGGTYHFMNSSNYDQSRWKRKRSATTAPWMPAGDEDPG